MGVCCALRAAPEVGSQAVARNLLLVGGAGLSPGVCRALQVLEVRAFDTLMSSEDSEDFDVLVSLRMVMDTEATFGVAPEVEQALVSALKSRVPGAVSAELMVLAPCAVPIADVTLDQLSMASHAVLAHSIERFLDLGLLVRPACTTPAELAELDAICRRRIERTEAALLRRGIRMGTQFFLFKEVSVRGRERYDLLLDLAAEPFLAQWCAAAPWMPLIKALLGEDVQVDVSVIFARGGADDQDWHSDGAHLGSPVAGWNGLGHAMPYAICVFLPLLDLTPDTGCTQFWPATHKYDQLLGFGPAGPVLHCTVDGLVPAGHAVIYDYRLMHRGLRNNTPVCCLLLLLLNFFK